MLYMRNFKSLELTLADRFALECLISLLITHPSARDELDIHVVFSSATTYHGLFNFENYRLMKAARLWGVKRPCCMCFDLGLNRGSCGVQQISIFQ